MEKDAINNKHIFEMAQEMLGVEYLHSDLKIMLRRANQLVNNAGGSLRSRQIVAAIIVSWEGRK